MVYWAAEVSRWERPRPNPVLLKRSFLPMILLLMRHGIAEDISDGSELDDAMRRLTPKGRRKVRDVASYIRLLGITPTHYVSSSRLRAVETAQEVMAELGEKESIVELDSMDVGGSWKALLADLQRVTGNDPDAVVLAAGHMPSIGTYFTAALLGSSEGIEFKKAAIAGLEWGGAISSRPCQLLFYLTPKYARPDAEE